MTLIREQGYVASYARLAGPSGARAASAAHQLLMRVAALCNDSLRENANEFSAPRRTSLDIVETIRQVIDILRCVYRKPYVHCLAERIA